MDGDNKSMNIPGKPTYPPSSPSTIASPTDDSWWLSFTKEITGRLRNNQSSSNNTIKKQSKDRKDRPEVWLLGCKYIRYVDDNEGFIPHAFVTESLHPSSILAALKGNPSPAIAYSRSELFLSDFRSRIYLTYRYNFPTLVPSSFTSDTGWGCMLRSGQMLLAQALVLHKLGREWRFGSRVADEMGNLEKQWNTYLELITWFIDSPKSMFSIHEITKLGLEHDLPVGEWYGPSTIAQSLKKLANKNGIKGYENDTKLHCYVAQDATIFKNQIYKIFDQKKTLLLLIPIRLGVENINPIYHASILYLFQLPMFLGIAGGRPNSAVYFVGVNPVTNELLYLDPHIARPSIPFKKHLNEYTIEELLTYHCDIVRVMKVDKLDPSLLLGFYCKDKDEFDSLTVELFRMFGKNPLFSILDKEPIYFDGTGSASDDGDWHDLNDVMSNEEDIVEDTVEQEEERKEDVQ